MEISSSPARSHRIRFTARSPRCTVFLSIFTPAVVRDLYKVGMNHICFAVDDIKAEVANACEWIQDAE